MSSPRLTVKLRWDYNNFIYKANVTAQGENGALPNQHRPGTQPLPQSIKTIIIRLANPHAMGLASSTRIENEVAAMTTIRAALRAEKLDHLIPALYGWAPPSDASPGYTIMQHMPGSMPDFDALDATGKQSLQEQMAEILAAIQRHGVPDTVTMFGGLRFDDDGIMVSAAMTLNPAAGTRASGPYASYADLCAGMLSQELLVADSNPVTKGWRANGIRERIEALLDSIPRLLGPLASAKKTLVSADFTTGNLLVDKDSGRVTALLDFDFAFVGAAADEYLRSFHTSGGAFPEPYDEGTAALRAAILDGFSSSDQGTPSPSPAHATDNDEWTLAQQWDQALKKHGAQRPCEIDGMDALSKLHWVTGQINPFRLAVPKLREKMTEEQRVEQRRLAEEGIVRGLEGLGV